ncbi:BspA family leucine-rich repeat surface protein [archaeon]|nr:MAG: BspA family leucine-rich repeat surface protein [archaeon]
MSKYVAVICPQTFLVDWDKMLEQRHRLLAKAASKPTDPSLPPVSLHKGNDHSDLSGSDPKASNDSKSPLSAGITVFTTTTPVVSKRVVQKEALMAWLQDNVEEFDEDDAEECADKCIEKKYKTVSLLAEVYYKQKHAGTVNVFLTSLIPEPLDTRLAAALEKACPAKSVDTSNASSTTGRVFTNDTLRQAVTKWCSKDSRAKADKEYGHISTWNTSQVTSMRELFIEKRDFNDDISQWNVSKVTSMKSMFYSAHAFNQSIGSWDVSKVTDMGFMFCDAHAFNQPIGSWDVSKVTDMSAMFSNARSFNQPIGSWDVSKVTSMNAIFYSARSFNQLISSWDVSKVTSMNAMFYNAYAFNQPIGSWDVSKVTDMIAMFSNARSFNQPIGSWDVSKVTDMSAMFSNAHAFNQPIGSWDVSKVTDFKQMFSNVHAFNQCIDSWDASSN